ncbi:MAG TPA: M20/M25/M40 family metallo-hydrolase, partial [Gemmatimonadales bacterium]|nr:M20/M25/M40 family metallo-hydrolase [Gemmatimonadales bacterium]
MNPLDLTRKLVEAQSPSGAEGPAVNLMHQELEALGWHVIRQQVTPGRDNLYALPTPHAPRPTPDVVFSTHLDCVPPYIPFREDHDNLYGRGTCDAKGLAAAMVAAAEQLRSEGEQRIALLFVVGEEVASDGAIAAAALEPKGSYLINGEPTEGNLCIGQKGTLGAELRMTGRAAHSGYPDEGVSAIDPLLDTLERIRRIPLPSDPQLGEATLNIGQVQGGSAPNVIPGEAMARVLFRTVGANDDLRKQLEAAVAPGMSITYPTSLPAWRGTPLEGWDTTIVAYASDLPNFGGWG